MKKILILVIASVFGVSVYAQINPIGEFVGDYSEGYEGFPNYNNGGFYQSLNIMGGNATINSGSSWQAIYEPGAAEFGLGDKGLATVNSGAKAWGEDYSGVFEIKFASPMVAFGAYWNYAYYSGATDAVTLAFYDSSNTFIGNTQFTDPMDNKMRWHGWSSNTPFSRIEIRGDYIVMDDSQALVPEPATILAVGAGLAFFIRRRKV
jgi:hypothetical protein